MLTESRMSTSVLLKRLEDSTTGLAAWFQAATHHCSVQSLEHVAVNFEHLDARGQVPDVYERHIGELAAPLGGNTYTTAQCTKLVAEVEPAVETGVG